LTQGLGLPPSDEDSPPTTTVTKQTVERDSVAKATHGFFPPSSMEASDTTHNSTLGRRCPSLIRGTRRPPHHGVDNAAALKGLAPRAEKRPQHTPPRRHTLGTTPVVGLNPPTGVDRQHESRKARSLYPLALQLIRALRLEFVGRAT
jgi:hypothetical protein